MRPGVVFLALGTVWPRIAVAARAVAARTAIGPSLRFLTLATLVLAVRLLLPLMAVAPILPVPTLMSLLALRLTGFRRRGPFSRRRPLRHGGRGPLAVRTAMLLPWRALAFRTAAGSPDFDEGGLIGLLFSFSGHRGFRRRRLGRGL